MSTFDSRHLYHLPWQQTPPPERKIVLVRGTTGMAGPRGEFIAFGVFDSEYHPRTSDFWFDVNNEHFTDQGWNVTHWCEL